MITFSSLTADVIQAVVGVTMAVAAAIAAAATTAGVHPCLAAETAVPVFSGSSVCYAAVEIIMAVDATITEAATTSALSSSFFCSAAEITVVDAADLFPHRKGRGYFLCPF